VPRRPAAESELEGLGATIVPVTLSRLDLLGPTGLTVMLAEASTLHRRRLRTHAALYDPSVRLLTELGELIPATHYLTAPFDKLAAPRADGADGTPITAMVHHTFQANTTGQPALSVPCGLSAICLPVGFQLLGRPFGVNPSSANVP